MMRMCHGNDLIKGVLLLLLLLLLLNRLPVFCSWTVNLGVNHEGAFDPDQATLSSFHKITLGFGVSINHEDAESLTAVPGIGIQTARSIVRERLKRGGYKHLDELKSIDGIGPVFFEKIKEYLVL